MRKDVKIKSVSLSGGKKEIIPDGALCDNLGRYIVTPIGEYIIINQAIIKRGFITEWTVSGDVAARTITLPLHSLGTFNCTVNWGDGNTSTINAYNSLSRIHTYATNGTYNVEIIGDCSAWNMYLKPDASKLTDIIYWGDAEKFDGFSHLENAFINCTNLKSTGVGKILAKNTLTKVNSMFFSSGINSIGSGLFDNCVNLSTNAFNYTFFDCNNLKTVPSDLFKYNVSALNFDGVFFHCDNLESLPIGLFSYNVNANSFINSFNYCRKLQLNKEIFYLDGQQGTRFLNKTVDFELCFTRPSYLGVQGIAPDLWNCNFGSGSANKTQCFYGGGNSLVSLSNYNDIPIDWK